MSANTTAKLMARLLPEAWPTLDEMEECGQWHGQPPAMRDLLTGIDYNEEPGPSVATPTWKKKWDLDVNAKLTALLALRAVRETDKAPASIWDELDRSLRGFRRQTAAKPYLRLAAPLPPPKPRSLPRSEPLSPPTSYVSPERQIWRTRYSVSTEQWELIRRSDGVVIARGSADWKTWEGYRRRTDAEWTATVPA